MYNPFYKNHLQRVSRSFSFCIEKLDDPFRNWVALSYLLCRVLDTIEDAPWENKSSQERAYRVFFESLNGLSEVPVIEFLALFPMDIPESERMLLADIGDCFLLLRTFPDSVQKKITRTLGNMQRGMQQFGSFSSQCNQLNLQTILELNQYCFFVAGVVGDLLTDLILELRPEINSKNFRVDAIHFGLFLQKVNILKDQKEDESAGRFLVPSRSQVLASLKENSEGAIQFLLNVPISERGFRLFCGWSLFLGLGSLAIFFTDNPILRFAKLPRALTEFLLETVEKQIDDNEALVKLFTKSLDQLPMIAFSLGTSDQKFKVQEIYQGPILAEDFRGLKILG